MGANNKFIEFYQIMVAFIPYEVLTIILAGIITMLWLTLKEGKNDNQN